MQVKPAPTRSFALPLVLILAVLAFLAGDMLRPWLLAATAIALLYGMGRQLVRSEKQSVFFTGELLGKISVEKDGLLVGTETDLSDAIVVPVDAPATLDYRARVKEDVLSELDVDLHRREGTAAHSAELSEARATVLVDMESSHALVAAGAIETAVRSLSKEMDTPGWIPLREISDSEGRCRALVLMPARGSGKFNLTTKENLSLRF